MLESLFIFKGLPNVLLVWRSGHFESFFEFAVNNILNIALLRIKVQVLLLSYFYLLVALYDGFFINFIEITDQMVQVRL
jgi:hypothetical protein